MRTLLLLISCFCFFSSKTFYAEDTIVPPRSQQDCAFCDAQVIEKQKFYEDDLLMVLYSHKPFVPCHILIVPKRHVERFEFLSEDEVLHVFRMVKKLHQHLSSVFHATSYYLLQKNGREAGQTVPHVHFHYIARSVGDDSVLTYLGWMYVRSHLPPLSSSKMQETVQKLKQAMAVPSEGELVPPHQ